MSAFQTILLKELKSMLRDPKILIAMIVVPVIIMGLMYGALSFLIHQTFREVFKVEGTIVVFDKDNGYWSNNFTNYIRSVGYRIIYARDKEEFLTLVNSKDVKCGIYIPFGFSKNISLNKTANINLYIHIVSPSYAHIMAKTNVLDVVSKYANSISRIYIRVHGLDPKYVVNPLNQSITLIIRNNTVSVKDIGSLMGVLMIINLGIPFIIAFLAGFLTQLTATSIAVEKEEKMFETLLSLPINRLSFIMAKITASTIIGLLSTLVYGGIFIWYLSSMTYIEIPVEQHGVSQPQAILSVIAKIYDPGALTLLFLALIGLVLFILGIAILLALFVESVQNAQIITSYTVMPIFFMAFLTMFIDLASLSETTRYGIALIPLINTCLVPAYIFIGDYTSVYLASTSSIIYALIVMYIASKLVTTEKVFIFKPFSKRKKR